MGGGKGFWTAERLVEEGRELLPREGKGPFFAARAPGRLDLLGGVGDYSGSLVLEWPLAAGCLALARPLPGEETRCFSHGREGEFPPFRAGLEELLFAGRGAFEGGFRWAAYVLGSLAILAREGFSPGGVEVRVRSDIPPGAGLASSAALEVSSLMAIAAALGMEVPVDRIPRLAQQVEHEMAGAPCGFMDQAAVFGGRAGALFLMDCSRDAHLEDLDLPEGVEIWAMDTGRRHSVGGRAYERARCAAFMGRALLGERVPPGGPALLDLDLFRRELSPLLPERMGGRAFLERFPGGPEDEVTRVDPGIEYPVRAALAFAVEERARVERFAALVRGASSTGGGLRGLLEEMGDLLFASHEGYRALGLGCPEADFIVEEVRRAREAEKGLFGARISGGGSGGSVAVLGTREGRAALEEIASALAGATEGRGGRIAGGTSPGARALGVREVRR